MGDKAAEGTASLEKALDVLDRVGLAPTGLSQAQLAETLKLPRTTLYRLLGTLVDRGLLRRDPLRRVYCIGQRSFEYARRAYSMPDLVAAAGAELRALRDMTGETTYLAALDGHEVVALERCDGAHGRRSNSALGQRKPLHCTSQGKAILAAMPTMQRDALVRELTLTAMTPRSITDRRRLQAELRATATRGWSIDDEEIVAGVRCCGAPIVDGDGQVRGAISVAGPAFRLTMERLALLGPEVADAARRIGAQLATTRAAHAEGEPRAVEGQWAFEGDHAVWSTVSGKLYWADRLAPAVHAATERGDTVLARFDAPITALLPRGDGLAVLSGDTWHRVDADGSVRAEPDLPRRRMSAVTLGPGGAIWACTADGDRWRVAEHSPEGRFVGGWRLAEPATSLSWDPTGHSLYIAAAGSGTIYAGRAGSSSLRRLATVPQGSGCLGGLAVDASGGVWAALRGGWSVVRFAADGSMDRLLALPVPNPTAVALGGDNARTLFVTSERHAVSRESLDAAPLSGRLFVLPDASASEPCA